MVICGACPGGVQAEVEGNQRKLKDKIVQLYHEAPFQPPSREFRPQAGGNRQLKDCRVCASEAMVPIGTTFTCQSTRAKMRRCSRSVASGPGMTVAEIPTCWGDTEISGAAVRVPDRSA